MTRITCIILIYRKCKLVCDLLESVTQHCQGCRVIVVDNASDDGSVEILRTKIAEMGICDW
jgi:glycosyltransferase involved in cell wall biosynthesis